MSDPDRCARFICGMPRSGTEWLTRRLNTHPDAAAFGETIFWGRHWIEPDQDGGYSAETLARVVERLCVTPFVTTTGDVEGSLQHLDADTIPALVRSALADVELPASPATVFTRVADAIARAEGKACAIEKTTHHVNWIDRIVEHLPASRFVVLLREPYGFMLSYKHQGDRRPPEVRREIERAYHPLWAALVWRGALRSARHAAAAHADKTLVLWHHDLIAEPARHLADIQAFLGLRVVDLDTGRQQVNTSFPGGAKPTLRAEDVFWMNLVNRRDARAEGLEVRRTPPAPLRITGSVLRLLPWGLRSYRRMRGMTEGSVTRYLAGWFTRR